MMITKGCEVVEANTMRYKVNTQQLGVFDSKKIDQLIFTFMQVIPESISLSISYMKDYHVMYYVEEKVEIQNC